MVILVGAVLLPMRLALLSFPVTVAVVAALLVKKNRTYAEKREKLRKRLSNLKSEGLFIDDRIGESDDIFFNTMLTILKDLERTLYKLVEKNIQLLSLKEIGRNIVSSLNEKKLVESVFDYLIHGVGYKEVGFILIRRKTSSFQAIVNIEKVNKVIRRNVNFDLTGMDGALYNSLHSGKSFMIKDVEMHPMGRLGERELFPGSTMSSYICVPLMKSSEKNICRTSRNCYFRPRGPDPRGSDSPFLSGNQCLSCPDIPLLGALIVTDGYRATPLTNIDQVTLETVGSLVSSNIENWLLYQELIQEEKFREKVFEGMIHGLVVTDLEGKVKFANRSAQSMTMMNGDEMEGMNIFDIMIDNESESSKPRILDLLYGEGQFTFYEVYLQRADGYHIPIRMNVSQFLDDKDSVRGAIITFVDLSDIRKMEEEIRHLDRLAALGRFTSAIAHEIRNPLTGIGTGIQYLKRSSEFNQEQDKSVESILSEVNRLNRIITDLFKVAKPRDVLYQECKVSDLIERSYNSIKDVLDQSGVEFEAQIEDAVPEIEVDPDQILQVLINLIKNAAESMEDGGKIIVSAECCDENVHADNIREKARMMKLEITDSGCGMDEKTRSRIFEPFFSMKTGGTGLGLFVSHSIIQHHHGKIEVRSDDGNGTTFIISLPVKRFGG